jgi:hypothetical protein
MVECPQIMDNSRIPNKSFIVQQQGEENTLIVQERTEKVKPEQDNFL